MNPKHCLFIVLMFWISSAQGLYFYLILYIVGLIFSGGVRHSRAVF